MKSLILQWSTLVRVEGRYHVGSDVGQEVARVLLAVAGVSVLVTGTWHGQRRTVILRAAYEAAVYGRTRLHLRILEQLLAAAIGGGTGFVRDGLLFTSLVRCGGACLHRIGQNAARERHGVCILCFFSSQNLLLPRQIRAVVTGVCDFSQDKTKT
ncbi:hypothetical protein CC79DRAFT_455015 [Sarocladium strictum]